MIKIRRFVTTISIPADKAYLLDWLDKEARRRGLSRSQLIIEIIEEYYNAHK